MVDSAFTFEPPFPSQLVPTTIAPPITDFGFGEPFAQKAGAPVTVPFLKPEPLWSKTLKRSRRPSHPQLRREYPRRLRAIFGIDISSYAREICSPRAYKQK